MPEPFADDSEFQKLVRTVEARAVGEPAGSVAIDLVDLMLEFAADVQPELDRQACRNELSRMATRARERIAPLIDRPQALRHALLAVSHLLYGEEGFHGNELDYYDPRNSYLPDVLARRTGIPISLGIIYMRVAAGAGLQVYGCPTPGHFVLGCTRGRETLYIDPFTAGDVLSRDACRSRLERRLDPPAQIPLEFFRPANPWEIAVRVLRNLKAAHALREDWPTVLPVQQRLALLAPDPDEQRDLGLVYLRTGQPWQAWRILEAYSRTCTPEQAEQVEPFLRSARLMIAEQN